MAYRFISPSRVRRFALEAAKVRRAQKFTRVGREFLDAVEANARAFITNRVMGHPSKGRTLN